MIKIASLMEIVLRKCSILYYRRLFREKTGQDVRDVYFNGKVQVKNPNVKIGKHVNFRGDCILDGNGPIVIGDNVRINQGTIILASKGGGVTIGNNTGIAAYSYIIDMDHGKQVGDNYAAQPDEVKEVVIGNNVWIAQNCTILKGSRIGDGAICAAKTVITGKEIPENAIVAGVPGKVIKFKG